MRFRAPLFIKIMLPIVILILLAVSLTGYQVYQASTVRWQSEMDTRLERVVTLLAGAINVDTLKSVRQPTDIDGPAYKAVADQLGQAVTAANLAWVGIYYREGDYFYYWVDQDYSGVGYPFFYATPEHFATYDDRQPRHVQYTDEFGSYYGYVAPIIINGRTVALVEALVDLESRNLLQRDTWTRIWPILLGGGVVAALLSSLITVVAVNLPLRQLQQGTLALARGQFGYKIQLRAWVKDELHEVADTFNQMSGQLERLYREQAERERIRREIEIARTVQQALFPAQIPRVRGLEIAAFCRPHRETSGDFYDLLALEGDQLGVVIGDVSGKSIPAALVMVAAQSTLRAAAHTHLSPAQVLDQSNVLLQRNMPRGMFVAASYARLDAGSGEMVWANAGQIYPVLLHRVRPADSQAYPRYLEATGTAFPLGLDAAINYDDQPLKLIPGDTILFYTDGVIEAMNPTHELYGFERLEALVRSLADDLSPQALIEAVLSDVAAFVGSAEQHDDITLVAVKLSGEEPA